MDYGIINNLGAVDLKIANQAQGDLLYFNGTDWVRLAAGTSGQVLKTQGAGANPVYGLPADLSIASQAQGDILYFNGTNWVRLAAGTSGYLLKTNGAGANPSWVAAPAGAQGASISSFMGKQHGSQSGSDNWSFIAANWTEVFDTGSNFNNTTGYFTAPQNGIYQFSFTVATDWTNIVSGGQGYSYFSTSVGTFYTDTWTQIRNSVALGGAITLSLTTGQTVAVGAMLQAQGAGGLGSQTWSYFSGSLLA